jgi:hypothetical protein
MASRIRMNTMLDRPTSKRQQPSSSSSNLSSNTMRSCDAVLLRTLPRRGGSWSGSNLETRTWVPFLDRVSALVRQSRQQLTQTYVLASQRQDQEKMKLQDVQILVHPSKKQTDPSRYTLLLVIEATTRWTVAPSKLPHPEFVRIPVGVKNCETTN